ERDVEVIARIHEEPGVPGRRMLGDPEWVMVVPRVVRGCRVHVLAHHPADDRSGLHVEPDRIEPHPRAERVATHLDHLDSGWRPAEARHEAEADERQAPNSEEFATRWLCHLASLAA